MHEGINQTPAEDAVPISRLEEALRLVTNPAGEGNILESGKVRYFEIQGKHIRLEVEGTNPALHARQKLEMEIRQALSRILGEGNYSAEIMVHVPSTTSSGSPSVLPGVNRILAVASGKGGVGKSTVAANLAVALAREGFSVGLVDGDVYGPSIPTMFDVENRRPDVRKINGKPYLLPVEKYGVRLLSIGFFAGINQAVAWRGPMASKALKQMFVDAWWGPLDYMIVDLPPGTGDIHLTLVQTLPLTGAIVVTTPQKVALADARKAISMFGMPSVRVPVLGLVENMAWFSPLLHPDERYFIFGKGGAQELAEEFQLTILAQFPLVEDIRVHSDEGAPIALDEQNPQAAQYRVLARNLHKAVNLHVENASL